MDRPKPHRLILLGVVLLAAGALLLLGRDWTSAPQSKSAPAAMSKQQIGEPEPVEVEPQSIEAAEPSAKFPTPLEASFDFRGRIIDAITREPVTEFRVELIRRREPHTEDPPLSRRFESSTGHFTWTEVEAGTWRAAIRAPGYQVFNVPLFQIPQATPNRETLLPLLRGFAVHGRVFELSTGAGIAGAYIGVVPADASDTLAKSQAHAESKDDGSFTLDGVAGGEIVLSISARGHAYRQLRIFVDDETSAQDIALSSGATIAGIVTTSAGAPVSGRIVLNGPGPGYLSETNETGRFSFNHMPAGRYRLSAVTGAGSATQELMLAQDEIVEYITLVVGAGRSVRGTLRDVQTKRLQSAQIFLRSESDGTSHSAVPDERGAFALKGVPPGPAVITAYGGDLQIEKHVNVPADRDITVDIAFPAGAHLSGRVTRGGKPAANWAVWMSPIDETSKVLFRARTSEDGNYEIEGVSPGDYRLRADQDISRAISITGNTVLNIDIPLVQLSARLMEDDGTVPIVGANVYVRGTAAETSRVRADKQTDDFGRFALTGIEPGEIALIVYKPGYELYREKLAYSSPITDRTITLRKSAGIQVRVRPGSSRFPRGFTITQSFANNPYVVDLWIPMDREGMCYVPSALAGTTFQIGRFSGKPIVIEDWDGLPFDLQ